MKQWLVILLVGIGTRALAAQGTVVQPEAPLDSARASLRDELLRFRDSLNTIDAAAARLHRDYRQASEAVLRSRARVMTDACARSARSVPKARQAVELSEAGNPVRQHGRKAVLQELDRLRGVLARCESEFGALTGVGKGEEVRGYGNDRAMRIQAALRRYERAVARYFNSLGIKTHPLGTPPSATRG